MKVSLRTSSLLPRPSHMGPALSSRVAALSTTSSASHLDHPPPRDRKTVLYPRHVALGGQIVSYANYSLPILYKSKGVLKEHLQVRGKAGLFDVSHMGQFRIRGPRRYRFLSELLVGDAEALKAGQCGLSLFCNEHGGIIDDLIVCNSNDGKEDYVHMVVNGARKEIDEKWMRRHLEDRYPDVVIEPLSDSTTTLLALQGPKSAGVITRLVTSPGDAEKVARLPFMHALDRVELAGVPCRVTRCGYTGEDGYEISVDSGAENGTKIFDLLLQDENEVWPIGLGARDSLRLEAGLCLYGSELNESITPFEAGLGWLIPGHRRKPKTFVGSEAMLENLAKGLTKKRVGLTVDQDIARAAPVREGAEIFAGDRDEFSRVRVGVVTSGTYSPVLGVPIAMGYVDPKYAALGNKELWVETRGKQIRLTVTKMPFVPAKYFKPEKA